VTDIATGWTENRSVRNKARKWVIAALEGIDKVMPFPLLGVDSDNGSEFINHHLLAWCADRHITFTRSRPGNSNDGAHIEQKNWAVVRTVVGYHRYDTEAELLLLNEICALQSQITNYFLPQPKLVAKVRDGAKITKTYDRPTTPHRRAEAHQQVNPEDKTIMADTLDGLNPAAIGRQIQAPTARLPTLTTSRPRPAPDQPFPPPAPLGRTGFARSADRLMSPTPHQRDVDSPVRCHYADDPAARPECTLTGVVRYGAIALCRSCQAHRSTLGKQQPPVAITADPEVDVLDWIEQAHRQGALAEHTLTAAVVRGRQAGHSWAELGTLSPSLNVTTPESFRAETESMAAKTSSRQKCR